ncbi:MAG: carboxypeptidase-like regulatory domain-containing protein [Saprospiraceae bacterium]|nr:carboxypeptidase-like regulatory domain-containing protein [Saprospiraceae bacterium]
MPRREILFFILIFFSLPVLNAQLLIEGRILSLPEKKPIPYANIGILNATVGTISDFDGTFSMAISRQYARDSVIFSALGYEKVKIPIRQFMEKNKLGIYLKEVAYKLAEVVVIADRGKTKLTFAGNPQFEGSTLYADTVNAGSAMALLIHNKNRRDKIKFEYPVYLHEAEVMIQHNTFKDFKVRVRILEARKKDGKIVPGNDLLGESVVMNSNITDGWLSFDLSPYQLQMEEDFFLAFEWILERKDRANLYNQYETFKKENPDKVAVNYSIVNGKKVLFDNFQGNFYFGTSFGMSVAAAILKENTCYYRLNSFGQWYPSPSILAARVRVGEWVDSNIKVIPEVADESLPNEVLSYYSLNTEESAEIGNTEEIESGQIFFSQRKSEPLEIYVSRDNNRLSFYARNHGFYPYQLQLRFSNVRNLEPLVTVKDFLVYPGRKQLLNLDVVYSDVENYHYDLSIKEEIGDPSWKAETLFPYLTPVLQVRKTENGKLKGTSDSFIVENSDWIVAMRKGIVTCMPHDNGDMDRIGSDRSLEILHADGTVMVYEGVDSLSPGLQTGNTVLPGDRLGRSFSGSIELFLFQIHQGGQLARVPVTYYLSPGEILPYSALPREFDGNFDDSIICLEMSEAEKRKWIRKNN